jgi:hypothetical protein
LRADARSTSRSATARIRGRSSAISFTAKTRDSGARRRRWSGPFVNSIELLKNVNSAPSVTPREVGSSTSDCRVRGSVMSLSTSAARMAM